MVTTSQQLRSLVDTDASACGTQLPLRGWCWCCKQVHKIGLTLHLHSSMTTAQKESLLARTSRTSRCTLMQFYYLCSQRTAFELTRDAMTQPRAAQHAVQRWLHNQRHEIIEHVARTHQQTDYHVLCVGAGFFPCPQVTITHICLFGLSLLGRAHLEVNNKMKREKNKAKRVVTSLWIMHECQCRIRSNRLKIRIMYTWHDVRMFKCKVYVIYR